MERSLSMCDLPESFLQQLCVQLPTHLQQRLKQTCRKLQQLMDAAVGVNLTWQQHCFSLEQKSAALQLPGVAESLVALNIECRGMTERGEAAQQAQNKSLAADIQCLGQLPRLTRLRCNISTAGDILAAVAAASPNLTRLELRCVYGTDGCSGVISAMCQDLLQLPPALRSLQHLQLDAGVVGMQCCYKEVAHFIGALTSLHSLEVLDTNRDSRMGHVVLKESYAPLQQLTALELPWCVMLEELPVVTAGPAGLQAITCLFVPQQGELSGAELGPSSIKINHYTWVLSQRSLTSLRLLTSWAELQVLQQGITDIAQQLQQLRDLALIDLNVPHSSRVTWGQLAPLAACTLLTRLELENFSLSKPEVEDQDHDAAEAVPGVQPALHAQIAVGVQPAWHLTSLRKLCMSSLGPAVWQSPLSCFAPNLTELGHKDFDEDDNLRSQVHLLRPATSLHARSTFTDAGLQQLAVLDTTINCLAVHASYADLASMNRLTELRIEMVGEIRLPDSSLGEVGLPMLPKLQRMVLYTNDYNSPRWAETYDSAEDSLLWQNQAQLQQLCIRGSARLGGILVNETPGAMPTACRPTLANNLRKLQTFELLGCPDLTAQQLVQLVGCCGVVQSIVVQQCAGVSDADCLAAERAGDGRCAVLYEA